MISEYFITTQPFVHEHPFTIGLVERPQNGNELSNLTAKTATKSHY